MKNDMEPAVTDPKYNPLINKHPPIWQELVIELFLRPRKFFSDLSILTQKKYVIAVTWIFGISNAIDRIDKEMLKTDLKPRATNADFISLITESWLNFWAFVLVSGAVSAVFLWWIGGWWYRKRLYWCGAQEADHRLARVVYIYASFVIAAPAFVITLIQFGIYDNYTQVYHSEALWPTIFLIFPFWSLVTSYIGIRTVFNVSKWKARMWFIILPGFLYLILFAGTLVALLALA